MTTADFKKIINRPDITPREAILSGGTRTYPRSGGSSSGRGSSSGGGGSSSRGSSSPTPTYQSTLLKQSFSSQASMLAAEQKERDRLAIKEAQRKATEARIKAEQDRRAKQIKKIQDVQSKQSIDASRQFQEQIRQRATSSLTPEQQTSQQRFFSAVKNHPKPSPTPLSITAAVAGDFGLGAQRYKQPYWDLLNKLLET